MTIASGQSIEIGDAVGVYNNEAVLADNSTNTEAIGLAKYINGATVVVQVSGKFSNSQSGTEYWLGIGGSLIDSAPTSGLVQQVAKRIDSQNILIDVDKTVIIL